MDSLHQSEMTRHLESLGAEMMAWGPELGDGRRIEMAESFGHATGEGSFEAEYAAIRRHVGILHLPQRTILQLTGTDVKDYLHRLCTQEINKLTGGQTVRGLQLNEKGHIAADLIIHHGDASTWLETDLFDVDWLRELIDARLFTEDVTTEILDQRSVFWLLGPAALRLMDKVSQAEQASPPLGERGNHQVVGIAVAASGNSDAERVQATAYRWDLGTVLGVRLIVPSADAVAVHRALLDMAGYEPDAEVDAEFAERRRASLRGRPIGWSAFNTVRVEQGVPMHHIDFGTDSLPAEAGLLDEAVSFTKGCYLGQEVVARMKSLGHPKKLLVRLELDGDGLPVAGAQVLEPGDKQKVIGGVTSSAASPLRGQKAVAIAMMRWGRHKPGTTVLVPAEGQLIEARVEQLRELAD
jgi:folate-binding protein YgfZ